MPPIEMLLSNVLSLRSLPEPLSEWLISTLTIPNPKWLDNERMGRWNRGTPKELRYYRKLRGGGLRLPRGYVGQLMRRLRREPGAAPPGLEGSERATRATPARRAPPR